MPGAPPYIRPSYVSTRFRVLQRDGFRCQYCGKTAKDDVKLEIDHIRPRCEGGTDEMINLITACFDCNRSKGGRVLDYDAEQSIMSRTEQGVRPATPPVRPAGISDSQWSYIQLKAEQEAG